MRKSMNDLNRVYLAVHVHILVPALEKISRHSFDRFPAGKTLKWIDFQLNYKPPTYIFKCVFFSQYFQFNFRIISSIALQLQKIHKNHRLYAQTIHEIISDFVQF